MGRGAEDHFGTILVPFWNHFGTIFTIFKINNMKIIKHMFLFDLFCLVAVLFYLVGDGEGVRGDHFGTILDSFWDHFI